MLQGAGQAKAEVFLRIIGIVLTAIGVIIWIILAAAGILPSQSRC